MAALAIRKSAWDGASQRDKTIFKALAYYLHLGNPATYTDSGGVTEWYVFDDTRFERRPLCYFAALAANVGSFPAGYSVDDKSNRVIRDDAMYWIEGGGTGVDRGLVLPGAIIHPDPDPNYWQTILDANGCPGWLVMANSVPDSWTPVSVE